MLPGHLRAACISTYREKTQPIEHPATIKIGTARHVWQECVAGLDRSKLLH